NHPWARPYPPSLPLDPQYYFRYRLCSRVLCCGMDRVKIVEHLALAESHVAEGQQHIKRQREIVRALECDGRDLATAKSLLAQFEETQLLHIRDRDRLRQELLNFK